MTNYWLVHPFHSKKSSEGRVGNVKTESFRIFVPRTPDLKPSLSPFGTICTHIYTKKLK